jgi:hypothetical protein
MSIARWRRRGRPSVVLPDEQGERLRLLRRILETTRSASTTSRAVSDEMGDPWARAESRPLPTGHLASTIKALED